MKKHSQPGVFFSKIYEVEYLMNRLYNLYIIDMKTKNNTSRAFTLVELLIVIVVIAILAVISIVAYNGIREQARILLVQSDLGNIAKMMQLYNVDNPAYPATVAELRTTGINKALSSQAVNIAINCGNAAD